MSQPAQPPLAWSVIVVNFDGGELLERCVGSVLAAAGEPTEIVIVDNASTDGSADRAAQGRETVRVLRNNTNVGFPRAVNQGLGAAAGERVLLLNPDTEIPGGLFRAATAGLEPTGPFALLTFAQRDDPDLHASTGALMSTGEIISQVVLRRRGRARLDPPVVVDGETFRPVTGGYLSGYCLAACTARLAALGGLDPGLFWAEDVDLSARARAAGATLAVCTSTTVLHQRSYSSRRNPALVTFFQLISKVGYARRHSPGTVPLIVATVGAVAGVRWAWFTLGSRRHPDARHKARAYRAVLRHLRTMGWRRAEGWDPALVESLRNPGAVVMDAPGGGQGEG